jgi:hypothetical protein
VILDEFIKLSRSSRNTVFAVLIIIASIAAYNWMIAPHTAYLSAAQQYKCITENLARKNIITTDIIHSKSKKIKEMEEQLAQVQNLLFVPGQAKKFFENFENLARETNCLIRSLNLNINKKRDKADYLQDMSEVVTKKAKLSVVGSYDNIIRLMGKLQSRSQLVGIESLDMKLSRNGAGLIECDMTISIFIYNHRR